MLLFAPVVRFSTLSAARVMFAENVIAPLFVSPMVIVPAVTRSSSPSVSPNVPALSLAPRLIAVPFVRGRIVTLPLLGPLIVGKPTVPRLLPISVRLPPFVAVVSVASLAKKCAKLELPPPSIPVKATSPPPEVICPAEST